MVETSQNSNPLDCAKLNKAQKVNYQDRNFDKTGSKNLLTCEFVGILVLAGDARSNSVIEVDSKMNL